MPPTDIDRYFRKVVTRLVRKDRVVQLDNRVYEVLPTLIDRQVELHFHPEEPDEIEVYFDGRSYGKAHLVNVTANKNTGREGPAMESETLPEFMERAPAIQSGTLFEGGQ